MLQNWNVYPSWYPIRHSLILLAQFNNLYVAVCAVFHLESDIGMRVDP